MTDATGPAEGNVAPPRTEASRRRRAKAEASRSGLAALRERFRREEDTRSHRRDALIERFGASGEVGSMFCNLAADASVQIERTMGLIRVAAESASIRAEDAELWAADRRADAARLALRLAASPRGTVARLMECPHGVDWLVDRWQMLLHVARTTTGWTDREGELAFDLMGIPRDHRWLSPCEAFGHVERAARAPDNLIDLCRTMLHRLLKARETAAEVDETRRQATILELADDHAPEVRRLRRQESSLHRRFRWMVELVSGPRIAAIDQAEPAAEAPETKRTQPPTPPEADGQNEPKPGRLADETNPPPPTPAPAQAAKPARPEPHPAKTNRPDPAKILRREKKRRRAA